MCQPYTRFGTSADAAIQQFHPDRIPHYGFEHSLVPVITALAPQRIGFMVAVAYNRTPARAFAAEHLDMDYIALSLKIPYAGETVHHVFYVSVDIDIGA